MKRIISLLTSIVIICTCFLNGALNVSAAGRAIIAFSQKNVEIGDTVTVTVSVSASEAMYAIQFALNYDPDVLKFQSGDSCSGGAGLLTVVDALDGVKSKSLNYTFKATKAGSCYIATADAAYVNENYEEVSLSNQGSTVRVKDITLSSNAKLKSLKVSNGSLSPKFSASTTLYKVKVKNSITDCNVYATAEDADAKVTVEGGSKLKVGENTCKVIVTAANGNEKTYKIVITREKAESSSKKPTTSKKPTSSKEESSSKEETSSQKPTSSESLDSSEVSSILDESENLDSSDISEETDSTDDLNQESSDVESEETSDENNDVSSISIEEIEIVTEKTETTKKKYLMPQTLENIDLPKGFEVSIASFDGVDVEVAKDKDANYILHYLKNTKTKKTEPYLFDKETQEFKKLQYIEQKSRYYIFAEVPADFTLPSGYYLTGSLISDFNINCYASDNPELSDFYYMYCFNGKDYEFYRYDTEENIIQRYPELDMVTTVDTEDVGRTDSIIDRFNSLTSNAKIVVLGMTALILFALILVVLLIFKILSKRGQAAMVNEWDYDAFDDIEINNSFGNKKIDFLTEEDDVESTEEIVEDVPDYLVDDEE